MITVQANGLLKKLKQAQVKEDNRIFILPDEMKAGIVTHQGEDRETPVVDISKYRGALLSILIYLKEQKYIEYEETTWGRKNVFGAKVCHAGWHAWQTWIFKAASFLFRSIAVPIVVAFLTALITSLIKVQAT